MKFQKKYNSLIRIIALTSLIFLLSVTFSFKSVIAGPVQADDELTAKVEALLPDRPFVISSQQASAIMKKLNINQKQLLISLLPVAKKYAVPPISDFFVGAAGLGISGRIYLGVNLEFPGNALNQTVHAEQFVITNASRNNEDQLTALAVTAAPCGHCRQFMNEVHEGSYIRIIIPENPDKRLSDLLPESFGPVDLGITTSFLLSQNLDMKIKPGQKIKDPELVKKAFEAANTSYAPYSKDGSGVAVRLNDGSVYSGKYTENAAFNPSLSPLQQALIEMVIEGKQFTDIKNLVLVERENSLASQKPATITLMESIKPGIPIDIIYTEPLKTKN